MTANAKTPPPRVDFAPEPVSHSQSHPTFFPAARRTGTLTRSETVHAMDFSLEASPPTGSAYHVVTDAYENVVGGVKLDVVVCVRVTAADRSSLARAGRSQYEGDDHATRLASTRHSMIVYVATWSPDMSHAVSYDFDTKAEACCAAKRLMLALKAREADAETRPAAAEAAQTVQQQQQQHRSRFPTAAQDKWSPPAPSSPSPNLRDPAEASPHKHQSTKTPPMKPT
jgi:hypothetical protein